MKHVVFDFDGTLVDSRQVFLNCYNQIAAEQGYLPMTGENLEALRNVSIPERCKMLGVPLYRLPWLGMQLARRYRTQLDRVTFNAGVPEMLRALRERGHPILILSTNQETVIRQFLQQEGLEGWVRSVYSSNRMFGKDQLLRQLIKKEKVGADQLLYVGDEERDIQACQKVGVRVAAVSWGYDPLHRLQQARPDVLIHHPQELLAHLS